MAERHSTAVSRILHIVDEWSGRAWFALTISVATLAVIMAALAAGFSTSWLTAFAAVVQAVTLVMVFVVQHTQDRDQTITQRKLDELLRCQQGTDQRLNQLEEAGDDQIDAISRRHARQGGRAREARPDPAEE